MRRYAASIEKNRDILLLILRDTDRLSELALRIAVASHHRICHIERHIKDRWLYRTDQPDPFLLHRLTQSHTAATAYLYRLIERLGADT